MWGTRDIGEMREIDEGERERAVGETRTGLKEGETRENCEKMCKRGNDPLKIEF